MPRSRTRSLSSRHSLVLSQFGPGHHMKLRSPFLCLESGPTHGWKNFTALEPPEVRSPRPLPSTLLREDPGWVLFGYNFTAPMDVSAKLAALTSALGPYGHVRPGRAAETPGFAFYIRGADFHHFLQNRPPRGTTGPSGSYRSTDGGGPFP